MKTLIPGRSLTATEAAREFSLLLDQVEAGADFVIRRHAMPVARISPALQGPRRLSACVAMNLARPSTGPDPSFAEEIRRMRAEAADYEPPAWE